MADDGDEATPVTPDEAFAVLGNEARLEIVRALGEAGGPLGFSELHDRVGVRDSGQFNYHLDQLVGHFVAKDEDGYRLRRPGRHVVEAILSGAVTATPTVERTRVDRTCQYCGAPVEIIWRSGSIELYCSECPGTYGTRGDVPDLAGDTGYLGRTPLPPAGLQDRDPADALDAGWTWGGLELLAISAGMCPRCSATIDRVVRVCEDHDTSQGLCETCDGLKQVRLSVYCTNCIYESGGDFLIHLLAQTPVLAFLADHGYNPVAPSKGRSIRHLQAVYEEDLERVEPFRATFTIPADDETLVLTVDDGLEIVDVERRPA